MTLATAIERLEAIDAAIAREERTVQFSDRAVTYRSMDELEKARRHYAGLVASLRGRSKQALAVAEKGF